MPPLVRTATPGISVVAVALVRPICCVGVGSLPESQFYDRQFVGIERVADMRGDVFSGWVLVDDVVRFAEFCEYLDELVVLVQYESVVQVCVDPRFGDIAYVCEVDDHPALVGFVGFDVDFDAPVVSVQMSTLAVVVYESVPVAEVDATGNAVSWQGGVVALRPVR